MGDKNNFLFGGFLRDFNMRFQAGEVLISVLKINACEAPVIGSCESVGSKLVSQIIKIWRFKFN